VNGERNYLDSLPTHHKKIIRDFLEAERSTNTTTGLKKAKQDAKKGKQTVAEKKKADRQNMMTDRQMQKAQKAEKKKIA
jgi:hypothetical protein